MARAIIIIIIVFIVVLRKNRRGNGGTAKAAKYYARVFIYNGDFRTSTYLCDSSYHEKDIVVVNFKGEEYAGRIVDISYQRPDDIPRNVVFKEVLRHFKDSDKARVAYWHDGIEKAIKS